MTAAQLAIVYLWVGITFYVLSGGADFGAGVWDLAAGWSPGGEAQRHRIATSIAPIWEANHVWLIFALVVLWTAFPPVFAAVASTLWIPFSAAAIGIICRGSAFVIRKEISDRRATQLLSLVFAASSVLTPFAFGSAAGAIASGRVTATIGDANGLTVWLSPTSLLGGALAVLVCAYLAATYLTADSERAGEHDLAAVFRRRALMTGAIIGVVGVSGTAVLRLDAPQLADGLAGRAWPILGASALAGLLSLALLAARQFVAVRGTAALAVTAALWSWGVAQYPVLLRPATTVDSAAAPATTLHATVIGLTVGALLVLPSLLLLYRLFQSPTAAQLPDQPGPPGPV